MTNKNKDILYKEVFNNLPKIQNSHQSTIGRLQNNNFIRCYHFIFDNYYTNFFPFFIIIIIWEIIVYQIKCIFYKFMIKPCNARAFNQYIYKTETSEAPTIFHVITILFLLLFQILFILGFIFSIFFISLQCVIILSSVTIVQFK